MSTKYEMVIGLETHVELKTNTKIFCGCSTKFGAEPNTQTCPICMGFPGTLPVLNKRVVELGIKAGLATNCHISRYGKQDRKNYFYPDLAKAYQISQADLPLCENGFLDIQVGNKEKRININRIHIEEDAGKLVHSEGAGSLVDYNRAGIPLIEIVSEPDLRSAEEAKAYLKKLRAILTYADISDAKMNEGSLRCDVNLSVREEGDEKLGTRTEMKNLNSFSSIVRAIESEFKRQVELIESGEEVDQETRRWDEAQGKSYSMRSKEDAQDYRYFTDPDLAPIVVKDSWREEIKATLPVMPDERKAIYITQYQLTAYEADQLCEEKAIADYFEACVAMGGNPKLLSTLILSEIFKHLGKEEADAEIPFPPQSLYTLSQRIQEEVVSQSAAKKIIEKMWSEGMEPDAIIEAEDLKQITDPVLLLEIVQEVITENADAVQKFLGGKESVFQALVGNVMKKTKGKASPVMTAEIMEKELGKIKE